MDPRTQYRVAKVQGASPLRLIILLYEQLIEDLRQAVKAVEEGAVEKRSNEINHAISVIAFLQDHLNYEAGGKVALYLRNFYDQLRARCIEAQACASTGILLQQITDLLSLREAWIEVERAEGAAAAGPAHTAGETAPAPRRSDWKV